MIKLTISIFLLLIIEFSNAQLSADAILKRTLSATGLDKKNIESFEITGFTKQGQSRLHMQMYGIRPDLYMMRVTLDSITVTKATNSNYSWQNSTTEDSVIFYDKETGMAEGFYQQWTGGLDGYIKGEITAELAGNDHVDGIEVYKLKLVKNNKVRYYYIDKISFLILKIGDVSKNENTYYLDYKKVDGLLLPHQMDGYKGTTPVLTMIFNEVQINPALDPKLFNAPVK